MSNLEKQKLLLMHLTLQLIKLHPVDSYIAAYQLLACIYIAVLQTYCPVCDAQFECMRHCPHSGCH